MTQQILLIRHGETEWSRLGRYAGRTDIPLSEEGRRQAAVLGRVLQGRKLTVRTSPLQRATETCRLAGFCSATVDEDLREWDHGIYDGRTLADILEDAPDWSVWHSPIEQGESLEDVAARARRVIDRLARTQGDVALFAHGHLLRVLAACWIGQPPYAGRFLALDPAAMCVLGYERDIRVIRRWNVPPRCGD